jgi:alpha-methylacyl-CoA racemase
VAGLQQNAPAPRFSRTVPDHPRAPPTTGVDTQAVLADWGIDPFAYAKRELPR